MKLTVFVTLSILHLSSVCTAQNCITETKKSGIISSSASISSSTKCWHIKVPENNYIRLHIQSLNLNDEPCSNAYVRITVAGTTDEYKFCHQDSSNLKPVTALNDVNITFTYYYRSSTFQLKYETENLICAQKNNFRCSNDFCVHQYQVCDGKKDCENGADETGCETGVTAVTGVGVSRERAIKWLKNQRSASFRWGKDTHKDIHRTITALYLSGGANFTGEDLKEELMAKQLELQTSVALLRNSTDPLSVSELSMFINALTVTCHNPRQFYGHDLLQILSERVASSKLPSPTAYLTLCNANWTFPETPTRHMLKLLHKHSDYPFHSDVQAMTIMALTCVKNRTNIFKNIVDASKVYETTIKNFISSQLPDGSFGNVYTTALITQALISSGQESNKLWKMSSTMKFLMNQLNPPSIDFLSTYLTLPILNGKSLVDLSNINCTKTRIHGEDEEISDVTNKLGGKMHITYSLYIGDEKDVVHTIYLRMPENSTAYDVMRIAQVADSKYKFLHRDVSGHMYVYEIAGIINDPEAGKFWLLYSGDSKNGTEKHHVTSPDRFIVGDEDHLIMWYKTVHM